MFSKKERSIIRDSWNKFFKLDLTENLEVRQNILDSWTRCSQAMVPYDLEELPSITQSETNRLIAENKELIDIVTPYIMNIYDILKGSECAVWFCNENGIVLNSICDDLLLKKVPSMAALLGTDFHELSYGTNAVGTCLYLDKSFHLQAEEHYNMISHEWVCSASPIHNENKEIIGCINIATLSRSMNAYSPGMVTAFATAIEKQFILENSWKEQFQMNNRLHATINTFSEGIITISKNKTILYINNLAKDMLDLNNKTLVSQQFDTLIETDLNLDGILSSSVPLKNHNSRFWVDNKESHLNVNTSYFKDSTGAIQGMVIALTPSKAIKKIIDSKKSARAIYSFEDIIGDSSLMKETIKLAKIASNSTSSVLLLGESGTGKELFAQAIHNQSNRRLGPFIAVNCGGLSKNLIESELFGYEGGSFTGAKKEGSPGKFELADGGTLFLDEIGEMPYDSQSTLLRVLQDKEIIRVGGITGKKVDVRIIAATNKNLNEAIKNNIFRPDLYYRLSVFINYIPPLRKRKDDILPLSHHFLRKYSDLMEKPIYGFSSECIDYLLSYNWPGNIRELENMIERAVNVTQKNTIELKDLDPTLIIDDWKTEDTLHLESKNFIEFELSTTLQKFNGNIKKTAEYLNVSRKTIYDRIQRFNIDLKKYR